MKFKFLKHTADIKFQARGKSLNELFENSALAMFKVMHSGKVKSKKKMKFKVKGKDLESLMYNFLEEFLFLLDSKDFLAGKVRVKISKDQKTLEAEVFGDDSKNYKIETSVKAVTYNEMFVKKIKSNWICQVVLDI